MAKPVAVDFIPSPNPYHRAWPLDLLRIAAALMVVAQHWSIVGLSDLGNSAWLRSITSYGYLGVDVFFFISGVVITLSAANSHAKKFTVLRFARLAPAYLIILMVSIPVGLYVSDSRYEISSIFSSLTFSEFVTQPPKDDLLILDSWTLWVEIQFYFCIALVLLLFAGWQQISTTSQKLTLSSFKVLFSIWLGFLALNKAGVSGIPVLLTLGGFATAFICGGLFGTITDKTSLIRLSPVLALASTFMFYGFYQRSLNSESTIGSLDLQTSHVTVSAVLVAASLFSVIAGLVARPLPRRVARVLTVLALATYPLYLMHQELGNRSIIKLTELGVPNPTAIAATFALSVGASIFISLLVEPPMRRLILRKSGLSP